MAGEAGLEPTTPGFGDQCSTNWAIPLHRCAYYSTIPLTSSKALLLLVPEGLIPLGAKHRASQGYKKLYTKKEPQSARDLGLSVLLCDYLDFHLTCGVMIVKIKWSFLMKIKIKYSLTYKSYLYIKLLLALSSVPESSNQDILYAGKGHLNKSLSLVRT